MRKRLYIGAAAVALLVSLVPAGTAGAQTVLTVKVSMGLGRDVPGFTARPMAPLVDGIPTIKVHTGDVVAFDCCVILLPQGQEADAWRTANQMDAGDPWALFWADPDADRPRVDAPSQVNARVFGRTHFDCGDTAENPCEFEGTGDPVDGALNTGDEGPGYVRINATPNSTIWAVPQIPRDGADLKIEVVPNADATTTQVDLDAARTTLRAQDRARALELMETLDEVNRAREDGRWVYDVHVGYDEGPVSLLAYFPRNLTVPRGSVVRYDFEHSVGEAHSATFPFKAGNRVSRSGFVPACDPDGAGPGPDTEAIFSETGPPCPERDQFEIDLLRRLTAEIGDGAFPTPKRRYESSGLRGTVVPEGIEGVAGGNDPWEVRFNRSSDTGFRYVCTLHGGFMSGKVRVR